MLETRVFAKNYLNEENICFALTAKFLVKLKFFSDSNELLSKQYVFMIHVLLRLHFT